jgi:hypothetical protein
MMKRTHRQALIALLAATALSACAHRTAPVRTLQAQLTPFEQTRTQAISLVTKAKRVLDPMSINQLEVAYTDLEVKANNYSGFIVESVDVGGLDAQKNATYAANLKKAIDGFNRSYNALRTSALPAQPPVADLSTVWVPSFADAVQGDWDRYRNTIASAPAKQKMAVTERIKRETVWPNFEDIATERLNLPQISRSH